METKTAQTVAPKLETVTVAEFCKQRGFAQINPKVSVNKNGYPFITFINGKNEAENVYFSKSASKKVAEGQTVTKEMLKQHSIAETENEAGEMRIKLVSSERVDLADLLAD